MLFCSLRARSFFTQGPNLSRGLLPLGGTPCHLFRVAGMAGWRACGSVTSVRREEKIGPHRKFWLSSFQAIPNFLELFS